MAGYLLSALSGRGAAPKGDPAARRITARGLFALALGGAVLSILNCGSAAAQANPGQAMTPPISQPLAPAHGAGGQGRGDSHHGGHHFPHPYPYPGFPVFVYPYGVGLMDGRGVDEVQFQPVNPAPFVPSAPPAPGARAPSAPYKPPSVEVAPGGIEIVRGPG
jgi:hypothetical protein